MYEYFDLDLDTVEFEWDTEKESKNFQKHGIKFKTAVKVFKDSKKLIRYDHEHPEEERYDVLGYVGKVLFVVITYRQKNVIRIISARKASAEERSRYYDGEGQVE